MTYQERFEQLYIEFDKTGKILMECDKDLREEPAVFKDANVLGNISKPTMTIKRQVMLIEISWNTVKTIT